MAYQSVLYQKDGLIATITLNRPEKLNAINDGLRADLEAALGEAEVDHDVSLVVIKGAGRAFCAGYDITPGGPGLSEAVGGRRGASSEAMRRSIAVDRENLLRSAERWMHMWSIPKPLIAQVHGYCLAGGNEITGCCDIIYAAEDAIFGQPQGRSLGIAITTGLWHVRIGPLRTKELLFTGDSISGKEAERIGMINRAVPAAALEKEVRSLAERIALTPVEFLAVEKAAVNRYYELMGIKTGVAAGAELDTIFHFSPPAGDFQKISQERGLKAALEWRDSKFGDARSAKKPVR
ncbi:MAG: enoyl-CoA hydratase/isomerase family protein [Chloroflexi bacterium]|nr:enoyl-CoA hydratase/isomerase family protein [Chloroflexota bacterium]